MVKRINISVSDELYEKIQKAKQGFKREYSLSKIFQEAIDHSIHDALARAEVWEYGFNDAKEYAESLSVEEQIKLQGMAEKFPRKYPEDLTELLVKEGLVRLDNLDNLKKHLTILEYWKTIFLRFEFMCEPDFNNDPNNADKINIWEWGGEPAMHDGQEIWDYSSDIRWGMIQELWNQGFIAGLKELSTSPEALDDEDD